MASLEVRDRPCGGFLQGDLPTGCGSCTKGAKMVLFVTGVCHYQCFYCPISEHRRMNRGAWANERYIPPEDVGTGRDLEAIAEEARLMRARGTGLTGGDPLADPERTIRFVRFLKQEFGPGHHTHLYTQIPFDPAWLPKLQAAGLDELRFHPPEEIWADVDAHPRYARLYREARELDWDVGFEIPCLPGWEEAMAGLVDWIDREGFGFINLNEFEFSETNFAELKRRGYEINDDVTSKARGSADTARAVMKRFVDRRVSVHFCSSPFKDAIQLRSRLRRRAESVALDHEVVTEDGTLLRGVLAAPEGEDLEAAAAELRDAYAIPRELVHVRPAGEVGPRSRNPDERSPPTGGKGEPRPHALGGLATTGREVGFPTVTREDGEAGPAREAQPRLEVAVWVLEEIAGDLAWPAYESEVYPTVDELEVERRPLNEAARALPTFHDPPGG